MLDTTLWLFSFSSTRASQACLNPCCAGYYSLTSYSAWWTMSIDWVLILVVLDTTLWPKNLVQQVIIQRVLILVVLDTTLWPFSFFSYKAALCLNPCCAGYYSLTGSVRLKVQSWLSLNPCCAGYYSLTSHMDDENAKYTFVLILVVLDTTLWLVT